MADHAHRNAFDFLRVAAATAVLFSHAFALYGWPEPHVLNGQTLGSAAVRVFFAVSGYLVAQSWLRDPSLARFVVRRALRIAPGLIVAGLVTTFVIGLLATTLPASSYLASSDTWAHLRGTVSLTINPSVLPGVFESNPFPRAVNGSLWTMRYEVAMYLILALLGLIATRLRFLAFAALAAVLTLCMALAFATMTYHGSTSLGITLPGLWRLEPQRFGYELDTLRMADLGVYFFLGVLLQCFRDRIVFKGWVAVGLLLIASYSPYESLAQVTAWIGLPYASLTFAWQAPALFKRLQGVDYSYGIYIYAFPVQQLVVHWAAPRGLPFLLITLLSLLGTLALAALSWHCVEKPALQLKPRSSRSRRVAA